MTRISLTLATVFTLVALTGCFGPSETDRLSVVQDDLVLHIEGKDDTSILRHAPDNIADMKITMDSGSYSTHPDTMEDLEEALEDFDAIFNGDDLDLTQDNIDITGDTARINLTFQVTDSDWDSTIPVRLDMQREDERWVIVGIHAFN